MALGLAAVVAFTCSFVYRANAAGMVDTDKTVTITAKLADGDSTVFAQNYNGDVVVDLYKIADVDASGNPSLNENFADSGIKIDTLKKSDVTAEDIISDIVEPAEAAISGKSAAGSINVSVSNGKGSGSLDIEKGVGIYLYVPRQVQDERYTYSFTSYILYAPTSEYIVSGTGSDDWQTDLNGNYAVSFNLKSEAAQRYGSLDIVKTLDTFNQSLGKASFVFDVEATLDGKSVFSNVYTLVFNGAGSQTLTVKDIPAGAEVTVTEVYSGASYTQVATATDLERNEQKVLTADIVADSTATVGFENDFDNRLEVGSIAVENTFVKDETAEGGYRYTGNNIEEGGAN